MFRKAIFQLSYSLRRPQLIRYYNEFEKTQWLPFEQLRDMQEEQLRNLIAFAYTQVPYYARLFNELGLKPADITGIQDLEKLPILTKQTIKQDWPKFAPRNIGQLRHIVRSTGGSTGTPLTYRMSAEDYERGVALLYRGWGYGGYRLGDSVAVIAGSSLMPTTGSTVRKKVQDYLLNKQSYSSFGMSADTLLRYVHSINRFRPRFIRGYASAIYHFAKFTASSGLELNFQPQAVFSASEKLLDQQRKVIERVLGAKVFDTYGLHDGGVSAYECEAHAGMHVDTERAILEVVDENGEQVFGKPGRILATCLYNYALPFIRYDTGDLGVLAESQCPCGRKTPLLEEITGRLTDLLNLNGRIIGSPVLTVLFGGFDIEQYQIIQTGHNSIVCKIVRGKTYEKQDEEFIRESFLTHVGSIDIRFEYVDSIVPPGGNKHKFIISAIKGTGV